MAEFAQITEVLDALRATFFKRLQCKTGWGKVELKLEFERAVSDTMAALWDKGSKEATK